MNRAFKRFRRKLAKSLKRSLRSRPFIFVACFALLVSSVLVYTQYMDRRLTVDPSTYGMLLSLVAKVESKDNYNAHFGNPGNTEVKFTDMPIADVLRWQSEYVQKGSPSDAVGRYQIISGTLEGLVRQLGIDPSTKFDRRTQDNLAAALIERRGAEKYVNGELTKEQFAANLAMEWAALPKVIGDNPDESYYASDGLNKSLVSINDVLQAIEPISPK